MTIFWPDTLKSMHARDYCVNYFACLGFSKHQLTFFLSIFVFFYVIHFFMPTTSLMIAFKYVMCFGAGNFQFQSQSWMLGATDSVSFGIIFGVLSTYLQKTVQRHFKRICVPICGSKSNLLFFIKMNAFIEWQRIDSMSHKKVNNNGNCHSQTNRWKLNWQRWKTNR